MNTDTPYNIVLHRSRDGARGATPKRRTSSPRQTSHGMLVLRESSSLRCWCKNVYVTSGHVYIVDQKEFSGFSSVSVTFSYTDRRNEYHCEGCSKPTLKCVNCGTVTWKRRTGRVAITINLERQDSFLSCQSFRPGYPHSLFSF